MQPRSAWALLPLALLSARTVACSESEPDPAPAPEQPAAGGTAAGGSTASTGGVTGSDAGGKDTASGGVTTSGRPGTGGETGGTASTGGRASTGGAAATAGGGSGETGGSAGSAAVGGFVCPPGPYAEQPVPGGAAAVRVDGVPPADEFIASDSELIIVEGPVWLGGNLYVSEINNGVPFGPGFPGGFGGRSGAGGGAGGGGGVAGGGGAAGSAGDGNEPPPSRILKITEAGEVSIAFADAGTNGLAVAPEGQLVGGNHKTGSITRFDPSGGAPVELVTQYQGVRFNSPNDLTFRADGTLYFTDPDYQAPSPAPQTAMRVYRLPPGSATPVVLLEDRPRPNGITLSPDQQTLYVSASDGVYAYPVLADGGVGAGAAFGQGIVRSSDGMGVDCAGNLYTTSGQTVLVLTPAGTELARISVPDAQQVTNVAFGGPSHTTLYITAQGSNRRAGLFKLASAVPGMPY